MIDKIRNEIEYALKSLGENMSTLKPELDIFITAITPALTEAMRTGDELSLRLIRDQSIMHMARLSLAQLEKTKNIVISVMIATIRILSGV